MSLIKLGAVFLAVVLAGSSGSVSLHSEKKQDRNGVNIEAAVSADAKDELEFSVTMLLGAIYATPEKPTTVENSSSIRTASVGSDSDVTVSGIEEVIDEIPMTKSALEQVEDSASELQGLETVALPEGIVIPETLETNIAPERVDVSVDSNDKSFIVDASTIVSETDENGVTSESRVISTSIFEEDKTLTSFHIYTEADFADQAELDPSSPDSPQNIPEGPGSDSGTPLDLDAVETPADSGKTVTDKELSGSSGVLEVSPAASISTAAMTTGQRNAAVAYARKHALSYNGHYNKYGSDCTNFVSQAMVAGGWKGAEGWRWQDKAWWHKPWIDSYTWAGAENFYRFTRVESKRGKVLTSLASPRPGDVIQAKRAGKSNISHTMIVTKKVGTTIYVSYHSTDRKDYPLAKFMAAADWKGATYFAHRI